MGRAGQQSGCRKRAGQQASCQSGLDSSRAAESGLDSCRAAERYSLDDRLSRVVSDVISVSTDRTRAWCREDVRSRIWRFVEHRRRFPSAILITEANCLTVVKRLDISCVLVMLIRHLVLSFLESLSHFIVILVHVHDLCQKSRLCFTTIEELCRTWKLAVNRRCS